MLDRVVRHHRGILQRLHQQPGRDRLARPQGVVLVVEHRLEADGAAGGVDLIVDHRQRTFRQRLLAVGRDRDHLERLTGLGLVDVGQLLFRRGEDHGDRLDLGDRHDAGLGRRVDDVADIDLTQAGDARDRRLDGGIIELGLGVGDRGIVGGDLRGQLLHGRALGIGLLLGREFAELGVALQVQVGIGQVGLILRLLGLGLVERGLVRPRIDLDQQIALFHQLAFGEGDLVDLAVDPGPHLHGVEALNSAKPGEVDREVGLLHRRDGDANGIVRGFFRADGRFGRVMRLLVPLPAEISCRRDRGDHHNPDQRSRFIHGNLRLFERFGARENQRWGLQAGSPRREI